MIRQPMRRPLLLLAAAAAPLAAVGALLVPGVLRAGEQPLQQLAFELSSPTAEWGERVTVTGAASPGLAGAEIVLELDTGDSPLEVARTIADALGGFSASFVAERSGTVTARVPTAAVSSEPQELAVVPRVRVQVKRGRAFVGAPVTARVEPASYAGKVKVIVSRAGEPVGRAAATVRHGRLVLTAPLPGTGRFTLSLDFPADDGLAARTVGARAFATARTLSVGASGPDVAGLIRRLAVLHVRIPGFSSTFGYALLDSVYAFQKAYGLPRTGVVGPQAWRMLTRAVLLRPRYQGPAAHIEVDKTRQILLDVRNGEVVAVIPVSTGATGNTPEGRHSILWKALATTTWLGPAILYRTMDFYGNSFAIHGFPSVPPYPASHGCVRIPIWTADWLYRRSPVGETVYVYR
jgi:N-acetylmuramoyl-L-alanine amidase